MPFDDKLWLRENTQEIENLKRYERIFRFWRRKSFLASKPMMSQGRTCLTSAVYFMKIKRKSLELLKKCLAFPPVFRSGLKELFDSNCCIYFRFRSKFSFRVHCYMLELYNDRLIDLLAPHGKDVSFDRKNKYSYCNCYV